MTTSKNDLPKKLEELASSLAEFHTYLTKLVNFSNALRVRNEENLKRVADAKELVEQAPSVPDLTLPADNQPLAPTPVVTNPEPPATIPVSTPVPEPEPSTEDIRGTNGSVFAQESSNQETTNALHLADKFVAVPANATWPWGDSHSVELSDGVLTLPPNKGAACTLFRNNGENYRTGIYRTGYKSAAAGLKVALVGNGIVEEPNGGYLVTNTDPSGILVHVSNFSSAEARLEDLFVVHEDDLGAHDAGEIWRPGYVKMLLATKSNVHRTLEKTRLDRNVKTALTHFQGKKSLFWGGTYGVPGHALAQLTDYGLHLWYNLPPFVSDGWLERDAEEFAKAYEGDKLHLEDGNEWWNTRRKHSHNWQEQYPGKNFDEFLIVTWTEGAQRLQRWILAFRKIRPDVEIHVHFGAICVNPYHTGLLARECAPAIEFLLGGITHSLNVAIAPYIGHEVADKVLPLLPDKEAAFRVAYEELSHDLLKLPALLAQHKQLLPAGWGLSGYEANGHTMEPSQDPTKVEFIEFNKELTRSPKTAGLYRKIRDVWEDQVKGSVLCWYCVGRPVSAWSMTGTLDSAFQYPDNTTALWKELYG